MLPHLAKIVDDICLIKSVTTDQFNHAPAQIFFNTGFSQPGRPSLGSWALYGLGAETQDLPAFVVMSTGSGHQRRRGELVERLPADALLRRALAQSGRSDSRMSPAPRASTRKLQRDTLDLVGALNRQRLAARRRSGDRHAHRVLRNGLRLQTSAPELMDLKSESAGDARRSTAAIRTSRPSPAPACSRGG